MLKTVILVTQILCVLPAGPPSTDPPHAASRVSRQFFVKNKRYNNGSPLFKVAGAVVLGLTVIALLANLLCFWFRSLKAAQEAARGDRRRRAPPPPTSGDDGPDGDDRARMPPPPQPPAPAAVAVEMVRSLGPLVCTYRRADGWREAACAVCLAELADGEAVRVLPACMHYFHTECVGEWLRAHNTCPLCHAPLGPAAAV